MARMMDPARTILTSCFFEGKASAGAMAACEQTDTGQFAFCEIAHPDIGQWTIAIRRKKGAGFAQISTTLLPSQSVP